MYHTFIFFLAQSGEIHPIPHAPYVALARREEAMPAYASQRVRLADWYVEVRGRAVGAIENETYSFLDFDARGYACPACDSKPEQSKFWQPTETERKSMMELLSASG